MTFEALPTLKPFFDWSGSLAVAEWIQKTPNVFPAVETFHLLALTILLGSILLEDLRLLGVALRSWTPELISSQVDRFTNWALAVIVLTGYLLFASEADKAYHNPAFFWKMILLAAAIAQHYFLHVRALRLDTTRMPAWARASALLSLGLWFGVGVMGRAIGFVVGTDS
jgi:hypothetical protein